MGVAEGSVPVLVVEDEPLLLSLYTTVLEQAGFAVLGAGCLAEARDVLAVGQVGVCVLDARLGGEDGLSLLPELDDAGVGTLVCSGSDDAELDALARQGRLVLAKPFPLERLTAAVAACAASR